MASDGRGSMAFVFADLAGSTMLLASLGDAYRTLLHDYHAIVDDLTAANGGSIEVSEGDGLFCVFPDATAAVRAAVGIQRRIAAARWPGDATVRCRIGVHTGVATATDEGLVGIDVHRGARIGAASQGGQILISQATADAVASGAVEEGWRLVDIGSFVLEGIGEPERLLRVVVPDLEDVIDLPRARRRFATTLPHPAHPLIGRTSDIEGATALLMREGVRLVTLTGPGGTGKTRLAIEIAQRSASRFRDGAVFIDLSAVVGDDRVLPAIGRHFGIRESSERTVPEAFAAIVGSAEMLLVLDNMEQVVGAGTHVGSLLEAMPNVRCLVTSRTPLRITWEHEYPLQPLAVPLPGADEQAIASSDAVTLFVERATAVVPGFAVDRANAEVVAEITRRLDGLPLAIELATARLRSLDVTSLRDHLDHRLSLLDRGPRDLPERHRTLRMAIQWSHDLLDDDERMLFRRLSVFAGGWTLGAATAVCVDEHLGPERILGLLDELVARSLVVFGIDDDGEPRYRMLETLREFSLEALRVADEEARFRTAHIEWCLAMTREMESVLATPAFPALLDTLDRERFNLREALGWASVTPEHLESALTLCGQVPLFWDTRGFVTEGVSWATLLLEAAGDARTRGCALTTDTLGWLAMLGGDGERSKAAYLRSNAMWQELGDVDGYTWSLAMHGMTAYNLGDLDGAAEMFEEASALADARGRDWLSGAWCMYGMAHLALARGDFATASEKLHATLTYSRDNGLTWGVGHAQLSLGVLAFMLGDLDGAGARLSESLRIRRELKDARGTSDCLGVLALVAGVRGDQVLAARLLGAASLVRDLTGHRAVPWLAPLLDQAQDMAQRVLGDAFVVRFREGRDLSADAAVTLAITTAEGSLVASADPHAA